MEEHLFNLNQPSYRESWGPMIAQTVVGLDLLYKSRP